MRFVFQLLILIFPAFAQMSNAATIQEIKDPDYGCILSLTGEITAGDTDRLRATLNGMLQSGRYADVLYKSGADDVLDVGVLSPSSLCLDSGGGSFVEAVKMMDYVYGRLGTVVRARAQCLSACSLIFMAGSHSTETDAGVLQRRFLHIDGKLGFHAPSLAVQQGNYSEQEVNRAYRISVAATAQLLRRQGDIKFDTSLLARMYDTPADDMFFVETVRAAAQWRIDVLGVARPGTISDAMAVNACENAYSTLNDFYTTDPDLRIVSGFGFVRSDVTRETRFGQPAWKVTGFGSEGAGDCRLANSPDEPFANTGQERLVTQSYFGFANAPEALPSLSFARIRNFMLYPGAMPLAALGPSGRTTAISGRCHVFRTETKIDEDPCILQVTADAKGTAIFAYTWPSGAKTVVELAGRSGRINGKDAFGTLARTYGLTADCYFNTASQNTFCFEPE